MTVLLVLGFFVVIATAHNITFLEVPRYGDPHREANLVCHYVNEKDDPPLHSVKWYRGRDEIFRYTPGQQPPTRTFNTTVERVTRGSCNLHSCSVSVVLPRIYNTRLSFTCEVSTEGPRFAVVKQVKNLTVAVTQKEDPVITGVPGSIQLGEDIIVNCTTAPAMPPANIAWYVDSKPEMTEPWMVNNTQVSGPNEFGLRSSWRSLRLRVATARGFLLLRCEATQPTWPPYMRSTNATIIVTSPHLSKFTASGSQRSAIEAFLLITCIVQLISKYSALSEI
ncbi:uncharacterized protein LOC115450371 [Manduca sexta]|uniref:Ig-like domain-containing protein n=1 Tax=Manduca sexta TaxID=7130 RepID=A0A921ZNS9_MANSE|nr:uncharacterized protein LOC115450371 [Manduca sexta]KAG6460658.1 hypothetical protein O3G_MSEX012129 [Manduca sexta]